MQYNILAPIHTQLTDDVEHTNSIVHAKLTNEGEEVYHDEASKGSYYYNTDGPIYSLISGLNLITSNYQQTNGLNTSIMNIMNMFMCVLCVMTR